MLQFKIGDKVEVLTDLSSEDYCGHDFTKGEIVEVVDICLPNTDIEHYKCSNGVISWYLSDEELSKAK